MKTLHHYILFAVLVCTQAIFAQVSFEATANKENIPLNDNVTIEFSMNSDGDNFVPPRFNDFTLLSGPNLSVSHSWINGQKSFKKSYSYILQPKRKGKISIGSASIVIDGETYKTQPLTVNITDEVARQDPRQRINQAQQRSLDGIHLVAEISKTNPYINEPVTVSYKLYFNTNIAGYRGKEIPTYDKFWTYNVELPQRPEVKIGKYKGQDYNYIILKQDVLMPQEVGKLQIKPLTLNIQAEVPTGRRDFFGFPEYGYIEKDFSSNRITLNVQELPLQNQPANFSGGVGDFSFKAIPSRTELKAGEPLNLTVEVSGKGNLNLVMIPEPVAHSSLEIYDPEYTERLNSGYFGMQGKRSNKYTIIPQYKGEYTIEPMEFSYFDIASKKYKTISTDSIKISVLEGPTLPTNKEVIGTDTVDDSELFQPIKPKASFITAYKNKYWQTNLFYILTVVPFIAIPLFAFAVKQQRKRIGDLEGNRLRRNNKLAKKYLGEAKKHLKNRTLFYEALERCLHNFLKAKLNIETSEMSNENIREILTEKQIDIDSIENFMDLKNSCEWARYAPSAQADIHRDYETAIQVISQLEKQFR